jgi:hypothetical protein
MGRTVMPFSYVLEKERGRWKEFRKELSKAAMLAEKGPKVFMAAIFAFHAGKALVQISAP